MSIFLLYVLMLFTFYKLYCLSVTIEELIKVVEDIEKYQEWLE